MSSFQGECVRACVRVCVCVSVCVCVYERERGGGGVRQWPIIKEETEIS